MIELVQVALVVVALVVTVYASIGVRMCENASLRSPQLKHTTAVISLGVVTLVGCILIGCVFGEAVPRIDDEFSYVMMSNTFASGHISGPSPPLPEFFDTIHVLVHPAYVSKYFFAQ